MLKTGFSNSEIDSSGEVAITKMGMGVSTPNTTFVSSKANAGSTVDNIVSKAINKMSEAEIKEMEKILRQIGIKTKSSSDSLKIWGNIDYSRKSIRVSSLLDHRILMSFFIANMICKKNNIIKDKSCVKTSYPSFFEHISQINH